MCVCGEFKKELLKPVRQPAVDRRNDRIIATGGKKTFISCVIKMNSFRCTVELHVSRCWVTGSPIIRMGDPSDKHFLTVILLHLLWLKFVPHLSNAHKELRINVLFVRK
jgi:hypothetical protein